MVFIIPLDIYNKYKEFCPKSDLGSLIDDKSLFRHIGFLSLLQMEDTEDIIYNNKIKKLYLGHDAYAFLSKDHDSIKISIPTNIIKYMIKYLGWWRRLFSGKQYEYHIRDDLNFRYYSIKFPSGSYTFKHPLDLTDFFTKWSSCLFSLFGVKCKSIPKRKHALCKLAIPFEIDVNNVYNFPEATLLNNRCSFTPKVIEKCKHSQHNKCAICRGFTIRGQVAHIVAGTRNTPRYYLDDESTKTMISEDIADFSNSIYLCRTCHEYIDNKTTSCDFDVTTLKTLKYQAMRDTPMTPMTIMQSCSWIADSVKTWQRKHELLVWLKLELEASPIFTEKIIAVIDELIDPKNTGVYDYLRIICRLFRLLPVDNINQGTLNSQIKYIKTLISWKFKDNVTIFVNHTLFNWSGQDKLLHPMQLYALLQIIEKHASASTNNLNNIFH